MAAGKFPQFVDYSTGTGGDTGEPLNPASVLPLLNGQDLDQTNIGRSPENIRQRTEAVRSTMLDVLYAMDADRSGMCLSGPGLVSWGGSTTAAGTGIVALTDNLYLTPFLTPGFPQTPPIPPVASTLGTITLQRVGPFAGIIVTSALRSYVQGHFTSIVVISDTVYSVTVLNSYRTIVIRATATTTLSTVIASLNALLVDSPTVPIVTAVLAGGAAGTDLILRPQAKQYMSGNVDAEAHTITPASLVSFFATTANKLAEGDSLCIAFAAMTALPTDPSPLGGRRQSIPENTNTTVPVGSLFNSRIAPGSLGNALPLCKVINGKLIFINGAELPKDAANIDIGATPVPATPIKLGLVELAYAAGTPATPIVAPKDANGGMFNAASGGGSYGYNGIGEGAGAGVQGTGGAGGGTGVDGTGGVGGPGVNGSGNGASPGVQGLGGATSGPGVSGSGGAPNGRGVVGLGVGSGAGGFFSGGTTGPAVRADGFQEMPEVADPATPASTVARYYFRSNGLSTPNHRTQFCVKWPDGNVTVVAESNPN